MYWTVGLTKQVADVIFDSGENVECNMFSFNTGISLNKIPLTSNLSINSSKIRQGRIQEYRRCERK